MRNILKDVPRIQTKGETARMISLILPTVRPDQLKECVNAIVLASDNFQVEFELIVVADFPEVKMPKDAFINKDWALKPKWIYEPERKGVVDANIQGYKNAEGEYIMTLSDEAKLYPGSLKGLLKFCQLLDNKVLTSPSHIPYFNFRYYGKWFAPFPFAHRSLIDACGGLFLPEFKCFYADPDLSLRAYEKGFLVKECATAAIHHPNNMACEAHKHNVDKYVAQDRITFGKKWAHLGELIDP